MIQVSLMLPMKDKHLRHDTALPALPRTGECISAPGGPVWAEACKFRTNDTRVSIFLKRPWSEDSKPFLATGAWSEV